MRYLTFLTVNLSLSMMTLVSGTCIEGGVDGGTGTIDKAFIRGSVIDVCKKTLGGQDVSTDEPLHACLPHFDGENRWDFDVTGENQVLPPELCNMAFKRIVGECVSQGGYEHLGAFDFRYEIFRTLGSRDLGVFCKGG